MAETLKIADAVKLGTVLSKLNSLTGTMVEEITAHEAAKKLHAAVQTLRAGMCFQFVNFFGFK